MRAERLASVAASLSGDTDHRFPNSDHSILKCDYLGIRRYTEARKVDRIRPYVQVRLKQLVPRVKEALAHFGVRPLLTLSREVVHELGLRDVEQTISKDLVIDQRLASRCRVGSEFDILSLELSWMLQVGTVSRRTRFEIWAFIVSR